MYYPYIETNVKDQMISLNYKSSQMIENDIVSSCVYVDMQHKGIFYFVRIRK